MPFPQIDWSPEGKLAKFARNKIHDLSQVATMAGPEKMEVLVAELMRKIDRMHEPEKRFWEGLSDFVIYGLIKPAIEREAQKIFDRMQASR